MLAGFQDDDEESEALCGESLACYRELGHTPGVAASLFWLGATKEWKCDLTEARQFMEEALELFQGINNREYIGWSYIRLGSMLMVQGEYTQAHLLSEESLRRFREQENAYGIAATLNQLARILFLSGGDLEIIHSLLEEGLMHARAMENRALIAQSLGFWGEAVLAQGDTVRARQLIEEAWTIGKELHERSFPAWLCSLLGRIATIEENYEVALAFYQESLAANSRLDTPFCLEGAADMAAKQGEHVWAARLWGTAQASRDSMGTPIPPVWRTKYDQAVTIVRKHLRDTTFTVAWAEGRALSPEQVLAAPTFRKPPIEPSSSRTTAKAIHPDGLTAREMEVLYQVAQGLTDAQIAEQLVISSRTVHAHLSSLYGKLGVTSRGAATRYAVERHLV
jgi:ATP/maltotriose-dependent transcriptional regulator MalT